MFALVTLVLEVDVNLAIKISPHINNVHLILIFKSNPF